MIQKITGNDYLKRVGAMSAAERRSFAERVGEWLREKAPLLTRHEQDPLARMQNVMQLCARWSDAEQQAWTEGARLLTAFTGTADTWLPDMIYTKALRRSIRNMVQILTAHVGSITDKPKSAPDPKPKPTAKPKAASASASKAASASLPKPKEYTDTVHIPTPITADAVAGRQQKRKRGRPRKNPLPQDANTIAPNANSVAHDTNKPKPGNLETVDVKTIIPRPKHIDQYAYLLPEATQQRAAQYGALMRDLGSARHNMMLLMDDPQANAAERERWAKVAVKIDNQVSDIRHELDSEWQKVVATGRVTIDVFGMAHIIDPETGKVNDPAPKVDFHKDDDKLKPEDDKPKRSHKKKLPVGEERDKRVLYLQKWLRDFRPASTDEHRKQWEQNAKELVQLGGNITESIRKAGEHYKVKIPKVKSKAEQK